MVSKTRIGRAIAAMKLGVALAALCFATHAHAQCIGYSVVSTPSTFIPGTTDLGLYADDGTIAVTFPFPISFYGTPFNGATVSTNGNVQFTTNVVAYTNDCLPTATFAGPTILAFWDDLYTNSQANGLGIFTDVSGPAGSQIFVIEWRTTYCCTAGVPLNSFEIKFYEGQEHFDVIYSTPMSDRASATIGCQDGAGSFTQHICNTAGPVSGESLRFSCLSSATAGACCNTVSGACSISNQSVCVAPNTFSGIGTMCAPNLCIGACCNPLTGICTSTGSTGCAAPAVFQGAGVVCLPNPCPQPPTGACCLANTQTCTEVFAATCAQQGGTYQGDTTTCGTAPCPFGACCLGCVCFIQTSAGCSSVSGTYQGNGATCASGPCSAAGTNIVANGDFETASFSGWTQFGDLGFTAVTTGLWQGIGPTGGANHAHFGPVGNIGGIEQTIAANPGDQVTIGFQYACTGADNSFSAIFDGQTLINFVDDTAHPTYLQFVFQATVTSANPTLRFECFNPPLYIYLDDIVACVNTGGPTGVCCRGSTCTTTLTSAAGCSGTLIAGQLAGASFPTGAACNAGGSTIAPCCYPDYNKLNGISVQDIFDFLNDWFASSPYANFGGTGGSDPLSVQNIFDYLNAWFAGGC